MAKMEYYYYLDTNVVSALMRGDYQFLLPLLEENDVFPTISVVHKEEFFKASNKDLYPDFLSFVDGNRFKLIRALNNKDAGIKNATFDNIDALEMIFEDNSNNLPMAFTNIAHELLGGNTDKSISEVIYDQKLVAKQIFDKMEDSKFKSSLMQKMEWAFDKMQEELSKHQIFEEKNYDGKKAVQKHISTPFAKIGAVKPPDIIGQIWNMIESDISKNGIPTKEQFFLGYDYENYIKSDNNDPFFTSILLALNMLGYGADKKLRKKPKFVGAMNDSRHLALAQYCNAFMSEDNRLIKKATAIYEYLQIATALVQINENDIQVVKINED